MRIWWIVREHDFSDTEGDIDGVPDVESVAEAFGRAVRAGCRSFQGCGLTNSLADAVRASPREALRYDASKIEKPRTAPSGDEILLMTS